MNTQWQGEGCIGCGSNGITSIDDNASVYVNGQIRRLRVDGMLTNVNKFIDDKNVDAGSPGSGIFGLVDQQFEQRNRGWFYVRAREAPIYDWKDPLDSSLISNGRKDGHLTNRFVPNAAGSRRQQRGGASLSAIISNTRSVLKKASEDPNGSCAKLFSKKGIKKGLELFEKKLEDEEINMDDIDITIKNDAGSIQQVAISSQPQIEGWFDRKTKIITLNPGGKTVKNALSAKEKEDPNNIRNQYAQIDLLSAILIHELLHATDDFGSDGTDVRKSIDFTKKVLESCFSKKAEEKKDD